MKHSYFFPVFIVLFTFSCAIKMNDSSTNHLSLRDRHTASITPNKSHWTYEGETGPEYWCDIEKNSECGGERQSPINIIDVKTEDDPSLKPLDIHYLKDVRIHDVTNNGHSIQYNFELGDYVIINNEQYDLKQIHFHEPSEHTINGIRYPLEMHLVHVGPNDKIVVLGILAKEGESSQPFTILENYLPVQVGETKEIGAGFDLATSLPKSQEYYTYDGSLTTPPCTENVIWYVFETPITISLEQVQELKKLMPINNYRNEQSINQRTVKHFGFSRKPI